MTMKIEKIGNSYELAHSSVSLYNVIQDGIPSWITVSTDLFEGISKVLSIESPIFTSEGEISLADEDPKGLREIVESYLNGKTQKILINKSYGGFGLSEEAEKLFGKEIGYGFKYRTDPKLIEIVEELGLEKSSGDFCELEIVEIPYGIEWEIHEYDGYETVVSSYKNLEVK